VGGESGRTSSTHVGRRRSTTRAQLSHIALEAFIERGFDETTIEDIAEAAGIGRRTFFRYFTSKNDLPWGDFDAGLADMRRFLRELPRDHDLFDALKLAVVEFNRFPAEEIPFHRERMKLLLNVPALVAHSSLRYVAWRQVIADYVALRLGVAPGSLQPQAIAWVFLGASLAAYEQWLKGEDAYLTGLLEAAFDLLRSPSAADTGGR
jgi:mycofactocin system transcriptional regulator